MGALDATKVVNTEFSGDYKLLIRTVTPAAASDTVTFVRATDGITEIVGAWACIESGLDAALTILQVSFSGLVVTIKQLKADGSTAADDWTAASIRLYVVGRGAND